MTEVVGAYVLIGFLYLVGTVLLSRKKQPVPSTGTEPDLFVFVVPALDEGSVVESTVKNLLAACKNRGRVLVIDDGSQDDTASVVESMNNPYVLLLKRHPPHARLGKGRALNHAYRIIRDRIAEEGYRAQQVVLCIVDADGRIQPDVLDHVAPYFRDPKVGAVQLLVRIRNRANWLGRFQDYEFLVFSSLTQTAREHLGSVGLGGNGQFTRLSALIELGENPWTDCLTEDLDLGVRLAVNGWRNRFCGETFVSQQGPNSISMLLRQRTRWAQGHFQCWRLIPKVIASQLPTTTVLDLSYYLLAPAMVLLSSALFLAGSVWIGYSMITRPEFWLTPFGLLFALFMYLFSFAPAISLGIVYQRRSRDLSTPTAILLGHLLAAYNLVWYIAELKAIGRIIAGRRSWTKTTRISEAPTPPYSLHFPTTHAR